MNIRTILPILKLSLVACMFVAVPVLAAKADGDTLKVKTPDGMFVINVLDDNAVRVRFCNDRQDIAQGLFPDEWMYIGGKGREAKWKRSEDGGVVTARTEKMAVEVDSKTGVLTVEDADGKEVFKALSHELKPTEVGGVKANEARLTMDSPEGEHLYGMGQFQDGLTNLRGMSRRLTQVNTQIAMPFMLSDRGYALLWNNYGLTELNPADCKEGMVRSDIEGERTTVNVTSTEGGKKETRVSNMFSATVDIPRDGTYALLLDVGQSMARRHNLTVDGKTLVDVRNLWLPPTTSLVCHLTAGKHTFGAELERNDRPVLHYGLVGGTTELYSPVARCVDYTVFVGGADEAIATYRSLTGDTPMLPKWAFGYIHCRERYKSQHELLDNARTFRERQIPIDLIVQDWQYWGKYGWNAMRFDEDHYPDAAAMTDSLHAMDMRLMLSVWSKVDEASELGKQMSARGYYIQGTSWVDFFNPEAAAYYWKNFSERLLKPYDIDSWWQDATEPENDDLVGRRIMNGALPGEVYRNVYPLLVSKTVYDGLRKDDPDRRAMIFTRSGYPGIQRYGSVLWTGDVGNDWETLRRQITAGLGLMSSGHPWWTYDAGGFFRPYDQHTNTAYQECMLRWIQTSIFFPMMRVHGYQSDTEPWRYGEKTEAVIKDYIKLRYRLLPYIYSVAAKVSREGYTMMRPMVFDFPTDKTALGHDLQFMFGPSLLVNPVTQAGITEQKTYLPDGEGGWYDYWTGKHLNGGQEVSTNVSIRTNPVFVRAGSILPVGPDVQHSGERTDKPILLRVYPGRDASFCLYDDNGEDYDYEKGKCASVLMTWDDDKRQLTLHSRKGSYDGMQQRQSFKIVLADGTMSQVEYTGKKIRIKM